MKKHPIRQLALLPLPLLLAATSLGAPPEDGSRPAPGERSEGGPAADYEVHEWGTFTSVLDAGGRTLCWNPFGFYAPLPAFVHRSSMPKPSWFGTVRMETPVVYFRAPRRMVVDVRVDFPAGRLTEWYPAAGSGVQVAHQRQDADDLASRHLAWNALEIDPELEPELPVTLGGAHYYAARGVEAASVRVESGEREKFLFYRGVGSFEQPLAVRLDPDGRWFELENRGTLPLARVLLFERTDTRAGFVEHGPLAAGSTVRVERVGPERLQAVDEASLAPLERMLLGEGLRADEARAMLATWREDWFDPGLRAFYVLPRATTDEVLPLSLEPRPRELVRVLVGRLELFGEREERELLQAARDVGTGLRTPAEAFGPLGERITRFALALFPGRVETEPALQAAEFQLQRWLEERARR